MGLRTFLIGRVPPVIRNRVRSSAVVRRLAGAAFWSTTGAASARLLGLFAGLILARVVGKIDFGRYGLIQTTIGMSAVVAGLGLRPLATKFVAELRQSDPTRAARVMTLSLVSALVLGGGTGVALFAVAPWLATEYLSEAGLVRLLRLGAVVLAGNTMIGVQLGALAGLEAFRTIARVSVLHGGLIFLGTVGGAVAGGLEGALWGMACATGVTTSIVFIVLRSIASQSGINIPARAWWGERRILFTFGMPGMLSTLVVGSVIWYGQALLAKQNGGFSELAEFSVAWKWRGLVALVPGLLCSGYLPVLSSMTRETAKRRLSLMWKTTAVSISAAAVLAAILCAASGWILLAYGPEFVHGRLLLIILAGQSVAESVNMVMRHSLTAMNRVWVRVGTNLVWAVVCMAGVVLLVPEHGALGLAISIVIAQVIHLGLQVPLAVRAIVHPGEPK